jgi:hypothetical protein
MDSYLYSSIILNLIRLVLDTINLYNIEPLRTTLCLELTKPPSVRLIFKQCDQVRSLLAYDKLCCSQTFFEDDCIECGKEYKKMKRVSIHQIQTAGTIKIRASKKSRI